MSIVDHFDHAPDAGLVRYYDSRAARRQFQISAALIVILTFAAFTVGFVLRFDGPTDDRHPVPSVHQSISLDA
jgi:hypothetical protein